MSPMWRKLDILSDIFLRAGLHLQGQDGKTRGCHHAACSCICVFFVWFGLVFNRERIIYGPSVECTQSGVCNVYKLFTEGEESFFSGLCSFGKENKTFTDVYTLLCLCGEQVQSAKVKHNVVKCVTVWCLTNKNTCLCQ